MKCSIVKEVLSYLKFWTMEMNIKICDTLIENDNEMKLCRGINN